MKTTQDYICQVLMAYRLLLNRNYIEHINQVVITTHSEMLYIAYAMIMRGEC